MSKLQFLGVAVLGLLILAPEAMARGGGAARGGVRGAMVGGMAGGSEGAKKGAKVGVVAGATRGVAGRTADRQRDGFGIPVANGIRIQHGIPECSALGFQRMRRPIC